MTAKSRLGRVRRVLLSALLISALGWGTALGLALLALAASLDSTKSLPLPVRQFILAGSVGSGILLALFILGRNRAVFSIESITLWLEDQLPEMRYALVTLMEGRFPAVEPRLEQLVADVSWNQAIQRVLIRGIGPPVLAAMCTLGVLVLLPSAHVTRVRAPHVGDVLAVPADTSAGDDPFHPLVVTVTPPPYSKLPIQTAEDPESVRDLAGSMVRIEGRGDTTSLRAALGTRSLMVSSAGGHWSISLAMPDTASAIWLHRGARRRLLVLLPRNDSVPVVTLTAPLRDSVISSSPGRILLQADIRDDFGVGDAWFEYIVSSGEGENFTFRSGVIGRRSLGARTGRIETQLALDSLKLAAGNIVHLRAVARDRNTVTGPGLGYSDTRTFRMPRPGEGDSVAIDAVAPAQGDSSLLSERMLILMTEGLQREKPRLTRDSFIEASRRIAGDQAALRRRVSDIIFLRLGGKASGEESEDTATAPLTPEAMLEAAQRATQVNGQSLDFSEDESPVVALNRPLLEAYNAMWDAGRSLEIGEPRQALPHMRAALDAIQRARQAERLYLRGRPTVSVVDLPRIRLAGKLADANPGRDETSPPPQGTAEVLALRFARAVRILPARGAIDSLSLLRIQALAQAPEFAGALDRAVSALRGGRDATALLIEARRMLGGRVASLPELSGWSFLP